MKLLHTSDLHIGKRVNEFSMLEDQEFILEQMIRIIEEQQPDGILIAGDIYDKNIPSEEGVCLFDRFLTNLYQRNLAVFIVSGNHDSSERLNFGGRIMEKNGIHIAGTFSGKLEQVTIKDEYGNVHIHMLPFVKPASVSRYYPEVSTYQEALEAIIQNADIPEGDRNVLIAHQFITNGELQPERCESENISVGGLDNIDVSVFDPFDYVALGHLHGAQRIGRDTVRYAGSPLKYSFSEAGHMKGVTMIELSEKGILNITKIPLIPLHDMRKIKGPINALIDKNIYRQADPMDYVHVILTDEDEIYDAIGRLRSVYPNIMRLDFQNIKTAWNENTKLAADEIEKKNPCELFEEFYINQNNTAISEKQKEIMINLFDEMEGGRK